MHTEASLKRTIKIQESPAPRYKYLKPHKYGLKLRWKVTRRKTRETAALGAGRVPGRGRDCLMPSSLVSSFFFF